MKKSELKKFEKLLLEERAHLSKGIRTIGDDTLQAAERDRGVDLTSFAEGGTDTNDRETALRVASGESAMLHAVDDALKRVEDGSYGVCLECDKPIPVKRLEVFPSAVRCVECKSKLEKDS